MRIAVLLPYFGGDNPLARSNLRLVQQGLQALACHVVPYHSGEWNHLVGSLDDEYVWVHDPDLLLPFEQVLTHLDGDFWACKPFAYFCRASQETSGRGECWQAPAGEPRLGSAFGKGSYLLRRQLLQALGGFADTSDPQRCGAELATRLHTHWGGPDRALPFVGTLLYRPRCPAEKALCLATGAVRAPTPDREALQAMPARRLPPERPQRLPGTMWAVTAFFNPEGYATKRANYVQFRAGLQRAGVSLCTVELAFGKRPFELSQQDADHIVQLRGGDVLWQKERLLNVAIAALPADCDKVAWLDADVLFDNPAWAQVTAQLLERYVVVQPFRHCVRLLPGESRCAWSDLPGGSAEHELLHGVAWGVETRGSGCLSNFLAHGHTGYGWAARRSLLKRHGLYELNILGNADLSIAHAMFGGCRFLKVERLSTAARRHLALWAERFYADVQGSVKSVEGTLFHLWHGSKRNRLYDRRLRTLIEHDYDPARDIRIGAHGTLEWSSDKPELHAWCRDYFALRQEDVICRYSCLSSLT